MSTSVMALCWPLQMPPTQKAVLVSLADNANDRGECWPSIPTIMARTCLGERTVHGAIKWLEQHGALKADRSNGRHTRYMVTTNTYEPPQELRRRSSCAPAADAANPRRSCGTPPQEPQSPPQELRSNRKEPSITKSSKSNTPSPAATTLPDWIDPAAWAGFADMRKRIRAPMTDRAAELVVRELEKFRADGADPNEVLDQSTRNGWRGVFPIKGEFQRGPPQQSGQPMGKQMQGVMALEELKNGARQRMAAGGSGDGPAETLLLVAGSDARR